MTREQVRYQVSNGRAIEVRSFDITGPTNNAVRSLMAAIKVDERDGWRVVKGSVQFGTVQNGSFQPETRRQVPLIAFDGYRRMSTHLR